MQPDVLISVGYNNTQVGQMTNAMLAQVKKAVGAGSNFGRPMEFALGRITGRANEFQKSLDASTARVVAFGATAGVLHNVSAAFKRLLSSAFDVERALTEINALLNLSTLDLSKFSSALFKVANETGQSFNDAAKAAQEFSRQGLGMAATLERTRSAMILTRLSGLALEESVSVVTAAINSFHRESLTAIDIVNRLANVDAKFAVSSADLAEALKRVGGSAADAGVKFNEVIALVTAAQQATARGGSVIGNSFKTIFTRLQRPQVLEDLEAMGVSIKNAHGENEGLIQILKNLAGTYDSLSSSQKSFVSETVGGVYQINILKSILTDLGSNVGAFSGALDAAADSTASAEARAKEYNKTLSAQLKTTINDVTKAFAGMGKIIIEPTIRGGLKTFDDLVNLVGANFSDEDSEGIGANLAKGIVQGFSKGIANVIAGPGIQFAIFGIIKLFQRLSTFVSDSVKDLTGINNKQKERSVIEKLVLDYMAQEKDLMRDLRDGAASLAQVQTTILEKIKSQLFIMREMSSVAPVVADRLQTIGRLKTNYTSKGAASGFIPNLSTSALMEQQGAKQGGYRPGSVISTSISNGKGYSPIIANTAETKSSIVINGQKFDWINPPKNSRAGINHSLESKRKTGIDPYSLGQSSLYSHGFVPNLNISKGTERFNEIMSFLEARKLHSKNPIEITKYEYDDILQYLGSRPKEELNKDITDGGFGGIFPYGKKQVGGIKQLMKKHGFKFSASSGFIPNLSNETITPQELVEIVSKRLEKANAGDGNIFKQEFWSPKKAGQRKLLYTKSALKVTVGGILRSNGFGGRYQDPLKPNALSGTADRLVEEMANFMGRNTQAQREKTEDFDIGDIERMLQLRGSEFAAIVGFEDFPSKKRLEKAGRSTGKTKIKDKELDVPFSFTGLKDPSPSYELFRQSYQSGLNQFTNTLFGISNQVEMSNESTAFGNYLNDAFKSYAKSLGVNVGEKDGENLDLLGSHPEIEKYLLPSQKFAGADIKSSLTGSTPNSMAEKIARALAFIRGAGRAEVPAFQNIKKFTGKGSIGLISPNLYEDKEELDKIAYAALSTGKPVKVQIGAIGAGKTSAALALGAQPVLNRSDIAKFEEFIINTDARSNLFSGILGISLASASNVVGFNRSKENIISNLKERISKRNPFDKRGDEFFKQRIDSAEFYPDYTNYGDTFNKLKGKLGDRFSFASMGSIPNQIRDALHRENLATGGNATLSQSNKLISSENPFGLVAIDKRNQKSAEDAISQHLLLGQSLGEIKNKKTASSGHIPNLATDTSSQMMFSAILAAMQTSPDTKTFSNSLKSFTSIFNTAIPIFSKSSRLKEEELQKQSRTIQLQKEWVDEYEKAIQTFREEKGPVSLRPSFDNTSKVQFNSRTDLEASLQNKVKVIGKTIESYQQEVENQRSQIRRFGFGLSIGGGLIGGGLSTMASKSGSPDLSVAVDQITGGAQMAGQALASFPNSIGRTIAGFAAFDGVFSAISSFSRGLESAKKRLEIEQTANQKLGTAIQGVTVSLSNLASMALDSTVSLDALIKEQKSYRDSILQIRTLSPKGAELASKIESSSSTEEKIFLLNQAKRLQEKSFEREANLFQIKELGSERAIGLSGTRFQSSAFSGGIFAGFSSSDREKGMSVVRSSAASIFSSLDEKEKSNLLSNTSNDETFKKIINDSDLGGKIITAIKSEGGRNSDIKLLLEQIKLLTNSEAIGNDKDVIKVRKDAISKNSDAQMDLDNAVKNEVSLRRLFLNSGIIRGSNELDLAKTSFKEQLTKDLLNNEALKNKSGQVNLLFGDKTNAAYESQIEMNRIKQELDSKRFSLKDATSRKLLSAFSLDVDSLGKPTFTGESSKLTALSLPRIGPDKEEVIQALANGLTMASKGGGLSKFIGKNGQLDFMGLEKEVIGKSGAEGKTVKLLQDFLISQRGSPELLNIVQATSNEEYEISQEALKEQKITNQKLEEIYKEIDLKRQLSFLGGMKGLTEKSSGRELEKKLVRGGRLMESGATPEIRARGAAMFAEGLKESGYQFSNKDQDAILQQKIADGLKYTQSRLIARVSRNLRIGNAGQASMMFNSLISNSLFKSAPEKIAQNFIKPEDSAFINDINNSLGNSTIGLELSVNKAKTQITEFADALSNIKNQVREAFNNTENKRLIQQAVQNFQTELVKATEAKASAKMNGSTLSSDVEKFQNKTGNYSSLIQSGGVLGAASLVSLLFMGKDRRKALVNNFNENTKDSLNWLHHGGRFNPSVGRKDVLGPTPQEIQLGLNKRDAELRAQKQVRRSNRKFDFEEANLTSTAQKKIFDLQFSKLENEELLKQGKLSKMGFVKQNNNIDKEIEQIQKQTAERMLMINEGRAANKSLISQAPANYASAPRTTKDWEKAIEKHNNMAAVVSAPQTSPKVMPPAVKTKGKFASMATKAGGYLGSTATGLGGALIGGALGEKFIGDEYGIGSMAGSILGGAAIAKGASMLAPKLASFAPVALGVTTAYAGLKSGNALYEKYNSKDFAGLSEGFQGANTQTSIMARKMFEQKKSKSEVRAAIMAQIESDKNILKNRIGGDGVVGQLIGHFTSGKEGMAKESIAQNQKLLESLDALAAEVAAQRESMQGQKGLNELLEKLISGGEKSSPQPINVEISLKDVDKIPGLFNDKIVKPLEQQLKTLQSRTDMIDRHLGINPKPSSI